MSSPNETPDASGAPGPLDVTLSQTPDQVAAMRSAAEGSSTAIPGYEIVRELGKGGMGAVYLAKQRGLHREVAVKTLLGASVPRAMLARFWAEAEVSWGQRRTCGRWG
ncbi:MAG: hypothetical protein ACKODX_10650 [Gemmata sp.]